MVDNLWPVDAVAGAPAYTGRKLRQTGAPALAGATAARPLGARSGVRPGTPASTATATSSTWTLKPFAGVIDFATAAEAGPYQFAFDADATGSVTAAAGSARIDILYVEGSDPAESAGAAPAVTRKYLAGTAGSGLPPATPARSFVVARINVPASGGGAPTVTWIPPYAVAAGGTLPVNSQAELDAYTPGDGAFAYRLDQKLLWVRRDGGWFVAPGQVLASAVYASSGSGAGASAGAPIKTPVLPIGQRVKLRATCAVNSASAGSVAETMRWLNTGADVTYTTGTAKVGRTVTLAGGAVSTAAPIEAYFTTTANAEISLGLYLSSAGFFYGADEQILEVVAV